MAEQFNLGFCGFAMLHNVSQCLLDDPEKTQRHILSNLARNVVMHKLDFYAVLLGELSAQSSHRGYQSLKVQFCWMKLV